VNQKIFVFVAIAVLAAALGLILLSSSFVNQQSKEITENSQINSSQILPISIDIDDISILKVTEKDANIEIKFQIDNPNSSSVIVQVIDYQLFETGFSNEIQISGGQIGSRAGGMVEFGNNYYTLLGENSITLKDEIKLKNTGNTPELWKTLENDSAKWKITGIMYYNLSSMTSGQENELPFEFTVANVS
jgi:LEA14-like dessication related protein